MNLKHILLGTVAGLLFAASAGAQTLVLPNITGNECWNAGQSLGGTTTGYTCAYQLRNGAALSIVSGSGAFTTTATILQSALMWHSTAPTSWTITTPAAPFDGEILVIGTDTTLTSLVTLTANTGQSLSSTYTSQTITAPGSVQWQYNLASTTWYRIR